MPSPFTPLKTSHSASKNNPSGDSCQRFWNVLCKAKCPESSNESHELCWEAGGWRLWKVLIRCYCTEHLVAYRKKCTALTTKTKFWPEECVAVLQIRCWLWCGAQWQRCSCRVSGEESKLLVPKCWLGGRYRWSLQLFSAKADVW